MPRKHTTAQQQRLSAPIDLDPRLSSAEWHENLRRWRIKNGSALVLENLTDDERSYLATCQKLYRSDTGSSTPFEEFFTCLVVRTECNAGLPLTPDAIANDLQTFSENWNDMRRDAARFVKAYPEKETTPPPVEPEAVAEPATTGKRAKAPRARKRHRAA